MAINLLPEEIVNQIAAGEVIENPSAVIKELVENSIDAKSTQIDIEIENSGLKKITVKDNGCGISKEDLLKAPLRHATSKIQNFNDLYSINTMGFRGEALASIFSVSKAKIISQNEKENKAWEISSDNINSVKESARETGTTIITEELFYNTPARKKYLKSDNLELKAILDIVNRFQIYYNNIKFTLKHNSKILINKPIFKTKEENLYYTLGKELIGNLLEINYQNKGICIKGFIGKPSNITYSFRKNQHLYVNSRYVKSKLIRDAIYEGFGTNLMEGRHPFFVLEIEIDPEIIDVNVHPTKIEIKFENELEIYESVRKAIKEIFERTETFKPFETTKQETDSTLDKQINNLIPNTITSQKKEKTYYTKDIQKDLEIKKNINNTKQENYDFQNNFKEENKINEIKEPYEKTINENNEITANTNHYGPLYEILKDYRILGQINKTFIILETPKEMIIVDQHVAEEKFFFETFKEQIENKQSKKQTLLKPEIIELNQQEKLLYDENKELIENLGFTTEEFGPNEIIIRAVPITIQKETLNPKVLKDIIHEITIDKKFKILEEEKIEKLASMSCKRSIKAGHEMTTSEIHKTIENLKKLKEPFNCPHGRPILLKWNFTELEKKFKRIV